MEVAKIPKSRLFGSDATADAARRFGLTVMCVTLLVTAAFGSGVYWNQLHAQGTPAHARMIFPASGEKVGRQALHRMWEDMQATADLYESFASDDGWRGTHSRNYLEQAREMFGK